MFKVVITPFHLAQKLAPNGLILSSPEKFGGHQSRQSRFLADCGMVVSAHWLFHLRAHNVVRRSRYNQFKD